MGANPAVAEPTTREPEREITRGVIALYKDYLGRGPTHAWTVISDEMVTTMVIGSMTKAEKTLVNNGKAELVREMRRQMQETMRSEVRGLIDRVLGKQPVAFLSDHDAVADIAAELILFQTRTVQHYG